MPTEAESPPSSAPMQPVELGIGILFDAIRDGIIVADGYGNIRLWNSGAIAIFGYTAKEALRMNVKQLMPHRMRERHSRGMENWRTTGHGEFIDTQTPLELPARRKDGEDIVIELVLSPVEVGRGGGREAYALAVVRDVTERVRLRTELGSRANDLERANARLREANESLEAFTYVVSHDLKEPVRAVEAYLSALREDYSDEMSKEARDLLLRAERATTRLGALLRGLLEFSRVSREELRPEVLDVSSVLEESHCRGAFEGILEERGANLEIAGDIPSVRAAHGPLCQILANLITNAARHGAMEDPVVRVRGHRTDTAMVDLVVEDNGPGFPPGLADRFNTGGTIAATAAGGFGLLIARRACERLGGRLRLGRSESLGGAMVSVTLPSPD